MKFQAKFINRGKQFRLVAEVIASGENLSDVLLARGLARPYASGKRQHTFYSRMAGENAPLA